MKTIPYEVFINNFGYVPPECAIKVPIKEFADLLDKASEDIWPEWWIEPICKGVPWVAMLARTIYKLTQNKGEIP